MQMHIKNNRKRSNNGHGRHPEEGFTLLEMVVAMVVLTIGLLGVASAISYALMATNRGRGVTNTKLLVVSGLEQMETLRNTKRLSFGQIANVGAVDNSDAPRDSSNNPILFSGFPMGALPVTFNAGPDGIHGTNDDLIDAGADQIYGPVNGVNDDFTNPALALPGYSRQITVSVLDAGELKKVQITLTYPVNGTVQTMTGSSYLNNDARGNYAR